MHKAGLQFDYEIVNVQDLIKASLTTGTPAGQQIAEAAKRGRPAPFAAVSSIVKEAVNNTKSGRVILSGIPNTFDQILDLEKNVSAASCDCTQLTMKRLLGLRCKFCVELGCKPSSIGRTIKGAKRKRGR